MTKSCKGKPNEHKKKKTKESEEKTTTTKIEPKKRNDMGEGCCCSSNYSPPPEQQLEEHNQTQTILQYSGALPPSVNSEPIDSESEDSQSFSNQQHRQNRKICISKRIKKKTSRIRTRPSQEGAISTKRRSTNHKKYTGKTVSNFLRKMVKKLGKKERFSFSIYEAKGLNKRGTRIYFNLMLLEVKRLMGGKFPQFINSYHNELDRLIKAQILQQIAHGVSERSIRYIEDFQKAKISSRMFVNGDYYGSIKAFFGTGKEQSYMGHSMRFFKDRKKQIGDETYMPEDCETYAVQQVMQYEISHFSIQESMQDDDPFDVLDLGHKSE